MCEKLQEIQKADAAFKELIVDFTDIRGFVTMEASYHNSLPSVELGCSNYQCQCSECLETKNSSIPFYSRYDLNNHSKFLTLVDDSAHSP